MSEAEKREETVFEAALRMPADQRAGYLDRECAGNAGLRRRVEALLGAFERAGSFMREPAAPERTVRAPLPATEKPGDRIGRYKLLEQIGEGGCGVVYVADQEEPVRRRVALKVIKLGMDTRQVIARFDAERQALAMMDHPNIAKVLDAGSTETGRPYFVMELVRGVRITDFCRQNQLLIRERLDLFIQVCRAIQHAHQKAIIHRDIKPSNILVSLNDGVPVPRVIDFGIAKATQGRLTDQTVYTAFEQFIGTPAYMSPEQAVMTSLDIDTRSDIYSLGVLLYELLTGTTPFDTKELLAAGLDEMRRTIREATPVKPSTRLTQDFIAGDVGRRTTESAIQNPQSEEKFSPSSRRLLQEVRGDLDWIVMKCLEKDRARRYETANGLAADIARHLNNEPIVARPPSKLYEFQKSVRRHKFGFAATGAVIMALVVGFALSTRMYFKAQFEKKKAQTEAARSQQVSKFLSDTLYTAGPAIARGRDATLLRDMLHDAGERVGRELKDQPEVQGDLWFTIGMTHWDIGDHPRAITNLQHAVESYRVAFAGGDPRLALALTRLGRCQSLIGDVAHGKPTAQLGLDMARKCPDTSTDTLIKCLEDMAASLDPGGRSSAKALPYLREALALHGHLGTNADNLRLMRDLKGKLSIIETNDAVRESVAQEILAADRQSLPPGDLRIAQDLFGLGQILLDENKLEEAEKVMREAVELHAKLYDKKHPRMPIVRRFLYEALARRGKWDEAESLIRAQLQDVAIVPEYWLMLVRLKAARGDWAGAIDEAKRAREAKLVPIDYEICLNLTIALLHEQRQDEYGSLCHELLERAKWADLLGKSVAVEISLLLPVNGKDFDSACGLADQLPSTNDSTLSSTLQAQLVKALAEYRRERLESTANWARRVATTTSDCDCEDPTRASASFIQAAALARLGRADAAREAWDRGEALFSPRHLEFSGGEWGGGWGDWTATGLLRSEAQKFIGNTPAKNP